MIAFVKKSFGFLAPIAAFTKKSFGFFLLSIIGFFAPSPLYRTIASRPVKRSYLRLLQGILGFSLYTAVIIHPVTPVLMLGVFLALIPLIMMSVAIDPFVSWLRGEDENPWSTFAKYLSQGLWAVIITIQPFVLILFLILLVSPEFMGIFGESDIKNARSIQDIGMFLIFSFFLTLHFFYSQAASTSRKQHKLVSSVVFAGAYLVLPVITVLVRGM